MECDLETFCCQFRSTYLVNSVPCGHVVGNLNALWSSELGCLALPTWYSTGCRHWNDAGITFTYSHMCVENPDIITRVPRAG